jgi:hypothetical protein
MAWDIVNDNLNKPWNWTCLWSNPTFLCSKEEICDAFIKHRMIIRIQHAFIRCYYNPAFQMCRKRLIKEFNDMNEEINVLK